MKTTPRPGVSLLAAALSFTAIVSARADVVTDWNAVATTAASAPVVVGVYQTRIFAMTQVAVHDALNAIDRRYRPYAFDGQADPNASPEAAVAAAAHDVLVHEVPTIQQPFLDRAYCGHALTYPGRRRQRCGHRGGQSRSGSDHRSEECGWIAAADALHAGKLDQACGSRRRPTFSRGLHMVGEGDYVRVAQRGRSFGSSRPNTSI